MWQAQPFLQTFLVPQAARNPLSGYVPDQDAFVLRTTEPLCGDFVQDVAGTLQGRWFKHGEPTFPEDPHIAFVHDNIDPSVPVISNGVSLVGAMSGTYPAPSAQTSGLIDRRFDQVTADGNIYCYNVAKMPDATDPSNRRFIVSMPDSTTLQVEYRDDGNCNSTSPWSFSGNQTVYER